MKFKTALLSFIVLLFSLQSIAQSITVTGRVTNKTSGEPLPGATIMVKGGQPATQTDASGNFQLAVPPGAILVFSNIGMEDQEVPVVTGASVYNVQMDAKSGSLNEVVVVGYGTQRRATLTGAISSVKARDLENVPNGRVEQALQGRVSGVTIMQNSGQPGSASNVFIRGITTFGNNSPLWVVDGVVIDAGGIGFLNQSDIQSIEVLKDAASAAIYGTRAATGVILVTTKKGRSGKPVVSYNGFYGTSAPAKMIDLVNATQYAVLRNESLVASGGNIKFNNVSSLGIGTDWQKAIFNNSARRYLHEVSMSGGNDRSTFYFSAGLQEQDGIVATEISKYKKLNFRLNSTHRISSIFSFGQTLGYTYQKSTGIGNTNSEFGGPLSSAINLDPITPLVVTDIASQPNANEYNNANIIRDRNGNPYGISSHVGQEMTNPLAYIQTRLGQYGWSDDIVGNAYLEAAPVKGLRLRSTVGIKKAYWGNIGYTPLYYLSATVSTNKNSYNKGENRVFNWNVENTATYSRKFGAHDLTVLLGQGTYVDGIGGNTGLTIYNLPINDYRDAAWFDVGLLNREGYAGESVEHKIFSLFSRINYTYSDKYLFTGIVRRDGSTRFGANKKYGIFPSFSVGWNVNRENFWSSNNVVNTLKLRGGYGIVGNDAIGNFGYLSTVVGGFNYSLGNTGAVTTGYAPRTLENPDLHWEETRTADIGFDAQLFKNFNLTVNWFNKKTVGILREVFIPGYVGVSASPLGNVADMKNTGVEVELGYGKQFGDFNFSINANATYLKNTVTYVAADTNFVPGGAGFQSMGTILRTQVGHPINSFWGYQNLGIFQNQAEIDAYRNKNGDLIQPNARPGDFKWADLNGDGVITPNSDLDKTFLGNPLPKYTFGFTINMGFRGFDFMMFAQGVAGNKIFQGLRRLDILTANYPAKALGRWHGEGTSTDYPRLTDTDPNSNFGNMSEFYLEKGDYLRLKVVQLGYTLPNRLFSKIGVSRFRVYVTAENLLTITNYTGYDPEVGGGIFGIDRGQYPQARSILGGLQISF